MLLTLKYLSDWKFWLVFDDIEILKLELPFPASIKQTRKRAMEEKNL